MRIEKKSKTKKSFTIILLSLLMAMLLTGCSDEEYEDDIVSDRDFLSEDDYPLGTAAELDGKIVVVSIFLNDNTSSWDFESPEDLETVQKLSKNVSMGLDWITACGKNYGKDIEFIYNWDNDEKLFYAIDIDCDFSDGQSNIDKVKTLIDDNFKEISNLLLDKYETENIIYAMYLNEPEDTNMVCYALPFNGTELGYDMPYEVICLTNYVYGAEQGPATYAHEMLHLFGAPDYYMVDEIGNNCGTTQEFVDYCENNMKNEIMFSTYDVYTNTIPKDKVTNDFSDLTAYFVGWLDSSDLADEFGLESRHEE